MNGKFLVKGLNSFHIHGLKVVWFIYFMISNLTATTQPLDIQNIWRWTYNIYDHSLDQKNTWFSITPVFSPFKTANMRSCSFRNEMNWSYIEFQAHFAFSFVYSSNSRTYETIRASKIRQIDFPAILTLNLHMGKFKSFLKLHRCKSTR